MQPPSGEHLVGTDNAGRDILSRVLYGMRNTLLLGLIGVVVGGVFGTALGIVAALYRWRQPRIMRCVDVLLAFPAILDRAGGGGNLRRRPHRGDHRAGGGHRAGRGAGGARSAVA